MIQNIAPHRLDNHYYPDRLPRAKDFVVFYQNQKVLVNIIEETGEILFPKVSDIKNSALIYLFAIDEQRFFLHMEPDKTFDEENIPGFTWTDMKTIRSGFCTPRAYVFAVFTAMHLAEWYRRKRFCGACGKKLFYDKTERAMLCKACGEKYYPRINPAVIVGVTNGDRLLITRYRNGYRHNALIAGFTEIGETLEETVRREVMEEAGIQVKKIRYYKSQPWGVASDLLAGFFCEVEGNPKIHMDSEELRYAQWVPREEIVLQPQDYSLTNEMMKVFKEKLDESGRE